MLSGYKTYLVAGVTVIGAVVSFLVGDISLVQAAQLAVPAILGATIRHGISSDTTK